MILELSNYYDESDCLAEFRGCDWIFVTTDRWLLFSYNFSARSNFTSVFSSSLFTTEILMPID
jgi:hypothetical protein